MRAGDLEHRELLELDPEGCVSRLAAQPEVLIDASAMGLLGKYSVGKLGLTAARIMLSQHGFAHGWRMTEAVEAGFEGDTDEHWHRAGTRTLEGPFRVEPGSKGFHSKESVMTLASYEAEQP